MLNQNTVLNRAARPIIARLVVSVGLEHLLKRELQAFDVSGTFTKFPGGITYDGISSELWKISLLRFAFNIYVIVFSRICKKINLSVCEPFHAAYVTQDLFIFISDLHQLKLNLHSIHWDDYLPFSAGMPDPVIKVKSVKSRLYHEKMLESESLDVIRTILQSKLKSTPDIASSYEKKKGFGTLQPPTIDLRMINDLCHVSIEATHSLSNRYWCVADFPSISPSVKAESSNNILAQADITSSSSSKRKQSTSKDDQHVEKETLSVDHVRKALTDRPLESTSLAACLLRTNLLKELAVSTYEKPLVLFDPLCSSGKLLIEAASLVAGHPSASPNVRQPFREFPNFSTREYYTTVGGIQLTPHPFLSNARMLGVDSRPAYIECAEMNLDAWRKRSPKEKDSDGGSQDVEVKFLESSWKDLEGPLSKARDDLMIMTTLPKTFGGFVQMRVFLRDFGRMVAKAGRNRGVYVVTYHSHLLNEFTGLKWRSLLRFDPWDKDKFVSLMEWTGEAVDGVSVKGKEKN